MKSCGVTEARSHFSLFNASSSICCEGDIKRPKFTLRLRRFSMDDFTLFDR